MTNPDSTGLPVERVRVVVVGGGPAGLTAAAGLAGHVDGEVRVIEREDTTGGIPRHSDHPGYGVRDLHRFLSGPAYARRLTEHAIDAGARLAHPGPGHRLGRRPPTAGDLAPGPLRRGGGRRRPGHGSPRAAPTGSAHPRRPARGGVHDRGAPERRPPAARRGRTTGCGGRGGARQLVGGGHPARGRLPHRRHDQRLRARRGLPRVPRRRRARAADPGAAADACGPHQRQGTRRVRPARARRHRRTTPRAVRHRGHDGGLDPRPRAGPPGWARPRSGHARPGRRHLPPHHRHRGLRRRQPRAPRRHRRRGCPRRPPRGGRRTQRSWLVGHRRRPGSGSRRPHRSAG